jgi:hypothetical protein
VVIHDFARFLACAKVCIRPLWRRIGALAVVSMTVSAGSSVYGPGVRFAAGLVCLGLASLSFGATETTSRGIVMVVVVALVGTAAIQLIQRGAS